MWKINLTTYEAFKLCAKENKIDDILLTEAFQDSQEFDGTTRHFIISLSAIVAGERMFNYTEEVCALKLSGGDPAEAQKTMDKRKKELTKDFKRVINGWVERV